MKKLVFILAFPILMMAQVKVSEVGNLYKSYSAATTGDTLFTATTKAAGSSIVNSGSKGTLVSLTVTSAIASDTIQILNGVGTVAYFILPSSGQVPATYTFNARLDTSLVYIQKKTSKITLIYKLN